jgi:hypothetical protein
LTAADYIKRTGGEPFVWGHNDCATWAASYWQEVTGYDPAHSLRGTYGTWYECRLVMQRRGGLVAVCRSLMAGQPNGDGDGICVAYAQGQYTAGILSGDRLWLKGDGRVTSPAEFTILERWTPCPKP